MDEQRTTIVLRVVLTIVPTPPKPFRIVWDQRHSLSYPSGFFPRDSLRDVMDPLDWHGDHIYTNFRTAFKALRDAGYYVDVLGDPYMCFDAAQYGTLIIVDPEDHFLEEEIRKVCTASHFIVDVPGREGCRRARAESHCFC
jgi:membrane-bound transcription factor site-1 protease